jgi:hypothetical protein
MPFWCCLMMMLTTPASRRSGEPLKRRPGFDALDHALGNGVEVDRGGNAAGRCAGNGAQSVTRTAFAVNRGSAGRFPPGAPTRHRRRIAEVTIVELAIEAAARAGSRCGTSLIRPAGPVWRYPPDRRTRGASVERIAADARRITISPSGAAGAEAGAWAMSAGGSVLCASAAPALPTRAAKATPARNVVLIRIMSAPLFVSPAETGLKQQ